MEGANWFSNCLDGFPDGDQVSYKCGNALTLLFSGFLRDFNSFFCLVACIYEQETNGLWTFWGLKEYKLENCSE